MAKMEAMKFPPFSSRCLSCMQKNGTGVRISVGTNAFHNLLPVQYSTNATAKTPKYSSPAIVELISVQIIEIKNPAITKIKMMIYPIGPKSSHPLMQPTFGKLYIIKIILSTSVDKPRIFPVNHAHDVCRKCTKKVET